MDIVVKTNNEDEVVARGSSGCESDYNMTVLIAEHYSSTTKLLLITNLCYFTLYS